MRTKLIVNPAAGRKANPLLPRPTVDDVVALLSRYEITADVSLTEAAGHASVLAAEAVERGYETVLVAGGDGTVHEVAQALVGTPVKLGILPFGSVMNLCRALSIPRDLEGAVQVIRLNHIVPIDVGKAPGRYFLEMVGIGIDAGIFRHLDEMAEGHWETIGDLIRFVRTFEHVPVRIRVDGRQVQLPALLVLVANSPYYDGGGLRLASGAKLNDGLLDVVVIDRAGKLTFLWYWLLSILPGRPQMPGTRRFRGREVAVESAVDLPAHADSFRLESAPWQFGVVPAALRVYAGFARDSEESPLVEPRRPRLRLPFHQANSD